MTDDELARGLGLTPEEAKIVIPKLTPKMRATYERLLLFANKWRNWKPCTPMPPWTIAAVAQRIDMQLNIYVAEADRPQFAQSACNFSHVHPDVPEPIIVKALEVWNEVDKADRAFRLAESAGELYKHLPEFLRTD